MHQRKHQAPITEQEQEQAGGRSSVLSNQAAWLGLAASGFWLLASWPLGAFASCLTGRQNFWACGAIAMGDGSAQCTGRKTTRRPAPSLQAGELSRSSS